MGEFTHLRAEIIEATVLGEFTNIEKLFLSHKRSVTLDTPCDDVWSYLAFLKSRLKSPQLEIGRVRLPTLISSG